MVADTVYTPATPSVGTLHCMTSSLELILDYDDWLVSQIWFPKVNVTDDGELTKN